jgi:LPS sulfotransferase NodH
MTQRSGSTLLHECLNRTGIAGSPGEHLYHNEHPDNPTGDDIADYAAYLHDIQQTTGTENGVFGTRLNSIPDLKRRLQSIDGYTVTSLHEAIADFFPNPHYIWLTRRNKVRQAISHWKAIQSGRWHSPDDAPHTPPEYKFEAIDHLVQELVIKEAGFQAFFAAGDIQPYVVVYEDFVTNLNGTVRGILDYCGIDYNSDTLPDYETTQLRRLADDLTEEWVDRYRREKQTDWWTTFW